MGILMNGPYRPPEYSGASDTLRSRLRFGIRHLLWLTLAAAGASALIGYGCREKEAEHRRMLLSSINGGYPLLPLHAPLENRHYPLNHVESMHWKEAELLKEHSSFEHMGISKEERVKDLLEYLKRAEQSYLTEKNCFDEASMGVYLHFIDEALAEVTKLKREIEGPKALVFTRESVGISEAKLSTLRANWRK